MIDPIVIAAAIGGIPATISAVAAAVAARNSHKVRHQVTPSNGNNLATIVERNDAKLDRHISDGNAHGLPHICPNCLTIEDE